MKIIGPCKCATYPVDSSRWKHLPKVHIEDVDEAGGVSVWHGYVNDGQPIKESLWQMSDALTKMIGKRQKENAAAVKRQEAKNSTIKSLRDKRKAGSDLTEEEQKQLLDILLGI
jgi:hypothetical protein